MKMDHNFIEQRLLEAAAPATPRRGGRGQLALVLAALLAGALAIASVPDPQPAASAAIADIA